jgi:nitroimidazol reductase NimA-like FMN-containing flavoprotein (pyridoxamine 5'-phosphate oxidase superfamily)
MTQFTPTQRTTIHRMPKRAAYDRVVVEAILDEGLYCHLGFTVDGQPYVIPTIHARVDDRLYVHGSSASRMLRSLKTGVPMCVTVTILDGLVFARSAFHHSVNYRSVVVLGVALEVTDPQEKYDALKAVVDHVAPNRWDDVRRPTEQELKATSVLRLPLEEVSAKIRTGPPLDDEEDYLLPCWAGELPLRLTPQVPLPDPRLPSETSAPSYIRAYQRQRHPKES